MGDRETITVAEVSDGPGGTGDPGQSVPLPVVELLTGRGFITGKSGSGKSNTASVVVENLLEASFPVLIVDIDGEYYGLKEKYEILHVGDDDECDIQVEPEHAEKIASLALEDNVPIILDVSSYLDEEKARELLMAVARQLFAKEKKLKKPFLLLVEEVHEYLPEGGGIDECGKMLIKIGKRGRKHGLGIVGISQRPADVKKDFITQCDWLVWHRLTWDNDTNVVRRVLDGEYAEAVEDLDDGEGFLMTDWSETVRRVKFHRKRTFDAGATPGLDDFERPELKSVSDDLVSDLQKITEQEQAREDRVQELREELDRKNSRIAELEKELQDARDMQQLAEQFTDALLEHVHGTNPGLTEQDRNRAKRTSDVADDSDESAGATDPDGTAEADGNASADAGPGTSSADDTRPRDDDDGVMAWPGDDDPFESFDDAFADGDHQNDNSSGDHANGNSSEDHENGDGGGFDDFDVELFIEDGPDEDGPVGAGESGFDDLATASTTEAEDDDGFATFEDDAAEISISFADISRELAGSDDVPSFGGPDGVVQELQSLDPKTRQMLRYYRNQGPGTPMDAHFAAGGDDDRTMAYARNRELRIRGFVEHVGRGQYAYRLPEVVSTVADDERNALDRIEQAFLSSGDV